MNKKIRNATPTKVAGIQFKSMLEARVYKALKAEGINPEYEKHTYTLSAKITATVPFFNRTKQKGFHRIKGPVLSITYTPDFTFKLNGIFVIMEAKGKENDVYPVKRNLFRKYLEAVKNKEKIPIMFFEVHSKKEALEAIKIVKTQNKDELS